MPRTSEKPETTADPKPKTPKTGKEGLVDGLTTVYLRRAHCHLDGCVLRAGAPFTTTPEHAERLVRARIAETFPQAEARAAKMREGRPTADDKRAAALKYLADPVAARKAELLAAKAKNEKIAAVHAERAAKAKAQREKTKRAAEAKNG